MRLPGLIGLSRAMDLVLTGRPVTAKEALDMGLANRVVPTGTGNIQPLFGTLLIFHRFLDLHNTFAMVLF